MLGLLAGCGKKQEKQKEKPAPKIEAIPVKDIHFFVETSSSMIPFCYSNDYKTITGDLYVKLGAFFGNETIHNYTIHEKIYPDSSDSRTFREKLMHAKLKFGNGSDIYDMLAQVRKKAKGGVGILVSDLCFYTANDPTGAKSIADLPDYRNNLMSDFYEMQKNGDAVLLYAFTANVESAKHPGKAMKKPFYALMLGPAEQLEQVYNRLFADKGFAANLHSHAAFGLYPKTLSNYRLFNTDCKNPSKLDREHKTANLDGLGAEPKEFWLGFNSSGIDTSLTGQLQANAGMFALESPANTQAKVTEVRYLSQMHLSAENASLHENENVFLHVEVLKMSAANAVCRFKLPRTKYGLLNMQQLCVENTVEAYNRPMGTPGLRQVLDAAAQGFAKTDEQPACDFNVPFSR